MKVVSKTYYHLQRINSVNIEWKVGDKILFDNSKENYYWKQLKQSLEQIIKKYNVSATDIKTVEENIFLIANSKLVQKFLNKILERITDVHDRRKLVQYYQERIYEYIRKSEFKNLPSRYNCIWIVPEREELKEWEEILASSRSRILKLQLNGEIHFTTGTLISSEKNENIRNAFKNASEYWNPSQKITKEKEYLFEGSVKIIDVIF